MFPLIAAHGALWAGNYFRMSEKIARVASYQFAISPAKRRLRLQQLYDFLDVFRDVNRRVCIETYSTYHFTRRFGHLSAAVELVPANLLDSLNRCHHAQKTGNPLTEIEKRNLFETFFVNEQETVVGPRVEPASEDFPWKLMKSFALRPLVRFAYFPHGKFVLFRNFSDRQERITNGLHAFDIAANVGWQQVESSLQAYKVLPTRFFDNSETYFSGLKNNVLAGA